MSPIHMFAQLFIVILFHWYFAKCALIGPVISDLDCGYSAQGSMLQEASIAFRTFVAYKSDVTFSLCSSTPSNFNTALTLYEWTIDPADATEIDDCDSLTSGAGIGCDVCNTWHEEWTLTLDSDFYYIEIYAYSYGNYHLDVSCTAVPTTATPSTSPTTYEPTISPTTNQPTTAIPTTYIPTLSPITIKPTTISPTNIPTNIPSNIPSNIPTNIPTNVPSHIPTNIPTNMPTNAPIAGANGEAQQSTMYNTGALMGNNESESGMDTVTLLLIIAIVLGVIVVIGALGCYICFIQKKKNKSDLQKQENEIEIGNIVPSDGSIYGTKGNTTQIRTDSTNNGIVRVTSVSMTGDGIGSSENVTGMSTNVSNINLGEDDDTGTDNEMYGSQEEMVGNVHESPGNVPVNNVTKGNVSVDFIDVNSVNGEGDILNEEMNTMYVNKNISKTAGTDKGDDSDENDMYAKPDHETTK